ncbi:vitamin K epoxide reductase family protein [Balneolaceae bacterium ANBcel3]|nr:vitamin K epoxide reductase family protein [Balneolaceae bacterium ANBcel3]
MKKKKEAPIFWIVTFLIVGLIGYADAVYLTAAHYTSGGPVCAVGLGCDIVAASEYSTIGPIPVALLGTLFYALMLFWGVLWLDIRKNQLFRWLPLVTIPAFLFSMWLLYAMAFLIEAFCEYCILSGGTTTMLMLISLVLRKKHSD